MIDKLFELLCGLGEPSAPALEPSDIKDANFQQLLSLVSKRRKVLPRSEKKSSTQSSLSTIDDAFCTAYCQGQRAEQGSKRTFKDRSEQQVSFSE